jgi:hypothetical protein
VQQCPFHDSPDDWGDEEAFLGRVAVGAQCFGRKDFDIDEASRYLPFGEGVWRVDEWDDEDERRQEWEDVADTGYEVFPVRFLDYGANGAELRETTDDRADGYIFVAVPWESDLERLAHVDFPLDERKDHVLSVWNMYLSGEVYEADIRQSTGDIIDTCNGLYGIKDAEAWLEERAASLKDVTRRIHVVGLYRVPVAPGGADYEYEGRLRGIDVPIHIGTADITTWAREEGPYKDDTDLVTLHLHLEDGGDLDPTEFAY